MLNSLKNSVGAKTKSISLSLLLGMGVTACDNNQIDKNNQHNNQNNHPGEIDYHCHDSNTGEITGCETNEDTGITTLSTNFANSVVSISILGGVNNGDKIANFTTDNNGIGAYDFSKLRDNISQNGLNSNSELTIEFRGGNYILSGITEKVSGTVRKLISLSDISSANNNLKTTKLETFYGDLITGVGSFPDYTNDYDYSSYTTSNYKNNIFEQRKIAALSALNIQDCNDSGKIDQDDLSCSNWSAELQETGYSFENTAYRHLGVEYLDHNPSFIYDYNNGSIQFSYGTKFDNVGVSGEVEFSIDGGKTWEVGDTKEIYQIGNSKVIWTRELGTEDTAINKYKVGYGPIQN